MEKQLKVGIVGKAARRLQSRKKARAILNKIMDNPENVIVIHYSCESFYDRVDGSSPRITSIAVRNLDSGQSTSFSIHQMGERKRYSFDDIEQNYNELEKEMLDEFYAYVRNHAGFLWLHWNMRNVDYGFQAIAHRYRVLGGYPPEINESRLINLSDLLTNIYGSNYVGHQRLPNITKKNKINDMDFLQGADEAVAFENKEYVKLHRSTLRKVEVLAELAQRAEEDSLKTDASWKDTYGVYPEAVGEWLRDNWLLSLILGLVGLIGAIASIISLLK